MTLNNLEALFIEQLEDLRSAEQQLTDFMPKLAGAANSEVLRTALGKHLTASRQHLARLTEMLSRTEYTSQQISCEAMNGLIREAEQIVNAQGNPAVKDAAIIAATQRVDHYEIAGYGTAACFAKKLGHSAAAKALGQSLDEAKKTDKRLTELAETRINEMAASAQ